MRKLHGSVRIARFLDEVFAYVDDWQNTTKYLRGLEGFEPMDPAKTQGLDAHFAAKVKAGPVTLNGEMVVVEHEPKRRVVFETIKGPKVRGEWGFRADGDHTIVELTNTFLELPRGITGRIVGKIIDTQAGKDLQGSLDELKRLLEEDG